MTDTTTEVPDDGKFHYKIGDVDLVLPYAKRMPVGFVRKNRGASQEDMLFLLIEYVFPEDSPEMVAFDSLDSEELLVMLKAWMPEGDIKVGESSAS